MQDQGQYKDKEETKNKKCHKISQVITWLLENLENAKQLIKIILSPNPIFLLCVLVIFLLVTVVIHSNLLVVEL